MAATTFQIISDTHLECCVRPLKDMLEVTADIVCLLGDIGSPFEKSYVDFLKECSEAYKHVLVITGNHEYYNNKCIDMKCINGGIQQICSQFKNVHFLNNSVFDIGDVRFIGSTLWTHMPEAEKYKVASLYSDYQYIYCEERIHLHPDYTTKMHKDAIAFIDTAVNEGAKMGKKNVVLTHHTPSFKFSDPKFADHLYRFGLATELSQRLDGQYIKYWASGHTHVNCTDMPVNGTTLICNQFGRRPESLKNFSKSKYYTI